MSKTRAVALGALQKRQLFAQLAIELIAHEAWSGTFSTRRLKKPWARMICARSLALCPPLRVASQLSGRRCYLALVSQMPASSP